MAQKAILVVRCNVEKELKELNEYLGKGWKVKSVTAQNVSISTSHSTESIRGSFLVIIEQNS
jgi:hypothetical protein